jgi:hypothetical protein
VAATGGASASGSDAGGAGKTFSDTFTADELRETIKAPGFSRAAFYNAFNPEVVWPGI